MPLLAEGRALGSIELRHRPDFDPAAEPETLQVIIGIAGLASLYLQRRRVRQLSEQQEVLPQVEAFAHAVHASLDTTEVAFLVANEGRRLCGCDRLSVAVRHDSRVAIEAVSGTDQVDKRSNLICKLRTLCEQVLKQEERLVFTGDRDDSLPPATLAALDDYLSESNSRLLIVHPLVDPRDALYENPPCSLLILESFSPSLSAEVLTTRLEVLGRHAGGALYNALEHRQVPLRFLWQPLARLQKGLGGTTRAITIAVVVAVTLILGALLWVPYPLKMDARGQLLPEECAWLFAPVEGQVASFASGIQAGSPVTEGQALVLLHDVQLELKVVQLQNEVAAAQHDVEALTAQFTVAQTEADAKSISGERKKKEYLRDRKRKELQALAERTHADAGRPGYFWLTSPQQGTVLNGDFRENLTNRQVKPADPLLRVGDKSGAGKSS